MRNGEFFIVGVLLRGAAGAAQKMSSYGMHLHAPDKAFEYMAIFLALCLPLSTVSSPKFADEAADDLAAPRSTLSVTQQDPRNT